MSMTGISAVPMENIIAFCVLMQNGNGIKDKSPEYVREKFETVLMYVPRGRELNIAELHDPARALDHGNQSVYHAWFAKWMEERF